MQSCRDVLYRLKLEEGENASLLMARYIKNLDDEARSRQELFEAMKDAAFNARDLYKKAFYIRQKFLRESALASSVCFETSGTLAAGMGSSNVLETGLALNPTYGIPMIPASSIKGVTAHYCSEVFGQEDSRYKGPDYDSENKSAGEIYEALFGKIYPEDKQTAGILSFYDAWLFPECVEDAFVDDVMTPHHGDYYSGKKARPSDFDDPRPVKFLSVKGKFEFWIACEDSKWSEFAFRITEAALQNYGIGGKITSGYGKMIRIMSPEEIEEKKKEQERQQNLKDGFSHVKGDIVKIICTKVRVNKKGNPNCEFAFAEGADKISIGWEQTKPQVNQGDTLMAEIVRIDKGNKRYILRTI